MNDGNYMTLCLVKKPNQEHTMMKVSKSASFDSTRHYVFFIDVKIDYVKLESNGSLLDTAKHVLIL